MLWKKLMDPFYAPATHLISVREGLELSPNDGLTQWDASISTLKQEVSSGDAYQNVGYRCDTMKFILQALAKSVSLLP